MCPSTLFGFLARCLALDHHPEWIQEVAEAIRSDAVDWEEFVWTGSSHYVLPALWSSLNRNGLSELLPEDLREHLENIYNLNIQHNKAILIQCRHLTDLLAPAGIKPLFMKGAGFLLSDLYNDPGDRMMEDIDILLDTEDITEAVRLLKAGGYVYHDISEDSVSYSDHHHLPPLYHPGQVATLEIHHSPVHEETAGIITARTLLDQSVTVYGDEARIPSAEHACRLIILHEQRSNRSFLSSAGSLKGLYDFYLLAKHRQTVSGDLPPGKFRKRYLRFSYFTSNLFREPALFQWKETPALKRYFKRELFLLDHPGWDAFWHEYIYAPASFLKLLVVAIWSEESRKLIRYKVRKFYWKVFANAGTQRQEE